MEPSLIIFITLASLLMLIVAVAHIVLGRIHVARVTTAKQASLIGVYSDIVVRHGIDSQQALAIREREKNNIEFLQYADAVDKLKRGLDKNKTEGQR